MYDQRTFGRQVSKRKELLQKLTFFFFNSELALLEPWNRGKHCSDQTKFKFSSNQQLHNNFLIQHLHPQPRKNFSARIFRENRKSCFSAGSGFFTYRPKFSTLLNLRPNQIGAAKYQATPLPPNTKSYSYSIPHLSRSLHDFIGSHGDSGGHIKQTVCCGKKVIFICIVVSCLYY